MTWRGVRQIDGMNSARGEETYVSLGSIYLESLETLLPVRDVSKQVN